MGKLRVRAYSFNVYNNRYCRGSETYPEFLRARTRSQHIDAAGDKTSTRYIEIHLPSLLPSLFPFYFPRSLVLSRDVLIPVADIFSR